MKYGMLTVIEEIDPIIYVAPSGKKHNRRQIKCICDCGKTVVKERSQLTTGKTKSCGCKRYSGIGIKTHGLSESKMYRIWASQKSRCRNKNDEAYIHYGGRGIIFPEYFDAFENWNSYIASLENSNRTGYSIDRIDNDKGYIKGNLRWATRSVQQSNRSLEKNRTGYKGVSETNNKSGRYRSSIEYKKIKYHIGVFSTAKDAAIAYNNYVISHDLPHSLNEI